MNSIIEHIEQNTTKYNSNKDNLKERFIEVSNKLYVVKGKSICFEPVITKYKIEEISQTICNGNISEKYYKEVPKSYYGEIQHDGEYFKHIEKMLSDNWEGDEEIFVPEEDSSKPFNTPKILGCADI